jgi:hypothetical protein
MPAVCEDGCRGSWRPGGGLCQGREAGAVGQKIFNLKTWKKLPKSPTMCGHPWDDSPNLFASPIASYATGPNYGPCTLLIACPGHPSFLHPTFTED